jgi:hypothetical protein
LLRIEDLTIQRNKSVLQASGQTGIGYATHLSIAGEQIDLSDLKILNVILPQEAQDPIGQADINIIIQGEIPSETIITSLDPILDLSATGEAVLASVEVAEIDVERCALNFKWNDRNLSFPSCVLKTGKSNIEFNLTYDKNNQIKGSLEGIIDLYEFRKLTSKYGRLEGKLGLNLVADGPASNPAFATSFWINDFQLNRLDFKSIEGSLTYSQGILTLTKPAHFVNAGNAFEISGLADLRALPTTPEATYLDLNLNIIQSDLFSALSLIEKINNEYSRRFYIPPAADRKNMDLSTPILPNPYKFTSNGRLNLYRKNGEADYFLKGWEKIYQETRKEIVLPIEANLGGELKGKITLRGKAGDLSGTFDGEVKDGFFQNFTFDKLKGEASLKEGRVEIKKMELSKFPGNISAKGDIGLNGKVNLELTAVKMPLEILKIIFDQEFKGTFNMRSTVTGSIDDPQISASLTGSKVSLSNIYFDQASIAFTKNNGNFFFHEFVLKEDGNTSTLSGSINLDPPGKINLDADLKNGALGLFNLVSNDVKWIEGKASANLKIRGTTEKPVFNGSAEAEDAKIYIKAIDSEFKEIKGSAKVENNLVMIPALTGTWQGLRTKGYPNFIGAAGTIDISRLLSEQMVSLNLSLSPGYFYVDLPNLYTGALRVENAHLYGPLRFDLSEGPTLVGAAALENAVINLTKNSGRKKVFPITYDLNVSLNQNVYAVMGDVATFDLSNIFMNLEIRSDELKIAGTSTLPSLLGKIAVRRGTVTIFNREFTLLSAAEQENYYQFDPGKIKENQAIFTGEKGSEGIKPNVTITAKVDVEEAEENADGTFSKKKVIILSRINGVIGATDKDRSLQISFDGFEEDQNRKPVPASYGEQEIKVMLLPDFIKSLTGVSKGEDVDANTVMADYIGSRFQTLIFRGIERDLEQRFGLESLTLEYNFGKDIRQAMGVTEQRILEEKPDWRVGFVKGLFDNFYVDIKYSQANLDTGGVESYLNYQLTYKLTPIWSIIYYREEPTGAEDLLLGDSKITLKAGFSFW